MSDFYERHPDALRLNADNYYSAEASADYWSNSQYKSFMRCEARQMAVMQGRWHDDDRNPALIGGNYMHTAVLEPEKLADYERAYPFIKKQALPSHEDLKAIAAENGVDLTGAKSSKPKTIERLRNAGVLPEPVTKWDHRYAWLPHAIRALT
ncbi:MAG: PD-(D/E)XK nuclease-like domain-containing protein, partial [Erythrobacter sp.]|nr:PD-(D/E)XK nuclease-like domain-containing protein [Erythrobacter sp.]